MSWTSLFTEKQILKKPAKLSVRGKEKMGCTTCLHPCGIQRMEIALDIQVQIFEIYAQNLWTKLK